MTLSDMLIQMLGGTLLTFKLFLLTLILSLPLGFLLTLLYISNHTLIKRATGFYILVMRGTPLLLQMFFIYFGLPFIPVVGKYMIIGRFASCAVAFILNYAAYFSEIFRGGLLSVDAGQFEAAKVLGLSKNQTYRKIIIPQMIRVALPSISNEAIILIKDTALITALAQPELLHVTKTIVNSSSSILPFIVAGVFYLVMSYVLTIIFRKLEKVYAIKA